jgi:glutathione S-transferase
VIDVYSAEFLDAMNPLRQIPTLITETGAPIYDSRVICMYLDAMSGRASLISAEHRWEIETRWALALGVMEAGLQRRMEITRPEGERAGSDLQAGGPDQAGASAPRAREWVILRRRRPHGFHRHRCRTRIHGLSLHDRVASQLSQLNAWLQGFARRPSMIQTRPSDPK